MELNPSDNNVLEGGFAGWTMSGLTDSHCKPHTILGIVFVMLSNKLYCCFHLNINSASTSRPKEQSVLTYLLDVCIMI